MKRMLGAFVVLAALSNTNAAEIAPAATEAEELVALVKSVEHEAQAIRFMIAVFPMKLPPNLADCTVREAAPAMRSYFSSQFAENLSKEEMQQAIEFFQSPAGQAVVTLRLEHEQSVLDAAAKHEQVGDEELHYPAPLQKELAIFGATPAGKFFVGDELLAREAIRARTSELRTEAMAKCMATAG